MGVLLATCAAHAAAMYWIGTQVVTNQTPLWNALEVSLVPAEKREPPPPAEIPVLLSDAFAERPVMEIPPPTLELAIPQEASEAIHAPPAPEPDPRPDIPSIGGEGYGPLTRPRVVSGPKYPQDRYPRASIRNKESGRTTLRICISEAGTVDSVDVAQTSGYPRLDAAALDMALDYQFAPAMREGQPVPVCLPYGIEFRVAVGGRR
jgi:periplasmic protein TonB